MSCGPPSESSQEPCEICRHWQTVLRPLSPRADGPQPERRVDHVLTPPLLHYTFIDRLKALPFVEAIYLFGSRARGTQRERSDIDLAIVCPMAGVRDWQTALDIVEDADTLLHVDCLRLDAKPAHSALRQQIEQERLTLFIR